MALLSVLIVFSLEFYFRWGSELRSYSWFEGYIEKIEAQFGDKEFYLTGIGAGLVVVLIPLLVFLVATAFSGPIYYLLLFVISVGVLFYCLGPNSLEASFERYFEATERDDQEAAYLILENEAEDQDLPKGDDLIRNATRTILIEANKRYFGVIFWFIFLGPFGALAYRLSHVYYLHCLTNEKNEHLAIMSRSLHWIDWAPARLSSFLHLLTGDFVNGFYRAKDYFSDFSANNNHVLSEIGVAALGLQMGVSEGNLNENRQALQMVHRTAIIYLVVVALLSPLSFW